MSFKLTSSDKEQLAQKNITEEQVSSQIEIFTKGIPFLELSKPAKLNSGVMKIEPEEFDDLLKIYDTKYSNICVCKFVPASGAATRMFKDLYAFRDFMIANNGAVDMKLWNSAKPGSVGEFFQKIKHFAFYPHLSEVLRLNGFDIKQLIQDEKFDMVIDYLLEPKGLNYGSKPKALIYFHNYEKVNNMAIDEHFAEGLEYACLDKRNVNLHFTVSPEHKDGFMKRIQELKESYSKSHPSITFHVSWSEQKSSTDTIAVDMNNIPIRDKNQKLVFRPAGHGALLENLNDLDSDVVFVKNIDNVVPANSREITINYKKVLAALLLKYQSKIFSILRKLDEKKFDDQYITECIDFISEDLKIPVVFGLKTNIADLIHQLLNRPIRVCGMVKNTGEPGGGPFWVNGSRLGAESLQIVESSQIDLKNPEQKEIFMDSTHFNPVDLVCGIRNYKGEAFDLLSFRDENTGFISYKSKDGQDIKALELPGLWNGAMADWITLFVEVPIETFAPVKIVNDLLRNEHQ